MQIRDRIKELRRVKASELIPNVANWRTHPEAQQNALRGILAEVGIADALLVRETPAGLQLLDGHLRADTSPDTEWPCLVLDVNDAEAAKLLATFDPLAAMAEADPVKLDALLREVDTGCAELQQMLADLVEEAGMYAEQGSAEITEDEVPEPPAVPITKPGDLWLLGEHRLLCGDSTKPEDVQRLMGGERVSCIFTDPPYGVSVGAKNRMLEKFDKHGRNVDDIADDGLSGAELEKILLLAFKNIKSLVMADDCTLFVCSAERDGLSAMTFSVLKQAGLMVRHVLVWVKNSPTFSMGRLDYDYQHEPILLTWLKRHKRPMRGKHKTSVWNVDKPRASPEHPTMKPVELYANAYLNNSDDGDSVFDAYSGSGTMFIAAEQVKRRAFGIELSPAYCDVIVTRWENLTGQKAKLETSAAPKSQPKAKAKSAPPKNKHAVTAKR